MHHQGAGKSDALAHAARQFLGIGGLESVKTDQVDGSQRPRAALGGVDAERLESQFHVL